MDWYKRDIGAYRRQTARLKPLAHGAYTLLLDEYYAGQGPLPADYIDLYRIAKAQTDAEKQCVKTVADQYFPLNGDGFRHNERADEEIANYRARSVTNRFNANQRIAQRTAEPIANRTDIPNGIANRPTDRKKETNKEVDVESPTRSTPLQNPLKKFDQKTEKPPHGLTPLQAAEEALKRG